jgi:hypothetical protein
MIYKFKSRATPDLIMMGPQGDQLLHLLGRSPSPQGIFEVSQLPAAIAALQAASAPSEPRAGATPLVVEETEGSPDSEEAVGLHQRLAPMLTMMTTALTEKQDIVWGV